MKRMMFGAAIAALSFAAATSAFADMHNGTDYYGRNPAPQFVAQDTIPYQGNASYNGGYYGGASSYSYGNVAMNCRSSSSSNGSSYNSSSSCKPDTKTLIIGALLQGYAEKRGYDQAAAELKARAHVGDRLLDIQQEGQQYAFQIIMAGENNEAMRLKVQQARLDGARTGQRPMVRFCRAPGDCRDVPVDDDK